MNLDELTDRQRQIFDFIIEKKRQVGYPPSVREIGTAVGLSSSSTVHSHLTALERKGLIRRDPTKPRALEIINDKNHDINDGGSSVTLPLIGHIAAGQPILAEENIEDYLSVPKEIANGSFLLKVKGDSMIEAGILDGDVVVIKKQVVAENGDIVAALIDDEATLKRFYKEGNMVKLQPENSSMDPIYPDNVSIIGKATGLLRLRV